MATRSRTTFQKRQKEMKRQEKQRMKADKRAQKSLARRMGKSGQEIGADQEMGAENGQEIESVPAPVDEQV